MIHDWNLHLTNDIPGLVVRTVPQLFGVAWLFVSCYLIEVKIIVIRDKWSLVQVKSVQGTPITPPHLCVAPCCCVALNSKSMHAKFLFFSGQIIMIRASVNKKTPRELVSCENLPIAALIRHVVPSVLKFDICSAVPSPCWLWPSWLQVHQSWLQRTFTFPLLSV